MQQSEVFDGETFEQDRDGSRLKKQLERTKRLMADGQWRSLAEISEETGDPEQSVSARLRDLRKPRFGGHTVERRYVSGGVWVYKLTLNADEQPAPRRRERVLAA